MTTAVLVGFQYDRGSNENVISLVDSIAGTVVDLYRVYRFCQKLNYQIYLFSDIETVVLPDRISKDIAAGDLDLEIMSFMKDKSSYILVKNKQDFFAELSKIKKIQKQALFYFTGHGEGPHLVMPSGQRMKVLRYRDQLLNKCSQQCQIVWLLDCCHPNNLNLPFKLEKNNSYSYLFDSEVFSQDIILITSSTESQKSLSTQYGSLFTRFFFQLIDSFTDSKIENWPSRNLIEIKKDINLKLYNKSTEFKSVSYSQNISLYFSQPGKVLLPLWMSTMKYRFKFDSLHNILIISENQKEK